jgi:copper chaperone CopZ
MQKTYIIPNISCKHCTHTIAMELSELDGVQQVETDLQTQKVIVTYQEPATDQVLRDTLVEINYPPEE